jgi:hypothetical protein
MAAKGRESGCWLVILEIRRGSTKLSLCLAEGTSQFREFCPPEEHQHDHEDDHQFLRSEVHDVFLHKSAGRHP